MWLLCGLDDENYAYPDYQWFDARQKAMQGAIKNLPEIFEGACSGKFDIEGNRISIDFFDVYDEYDHFYVYEMFEVNKEYALVYHHAYNGVDFEVKELDTRSEAIIQMARDYNDLQNPEYTEDNEIDTSRGTAFVDDGTEWHIWNILRKGE